MVDVVLEFAGLEGYEADNGGGFGGRCDFVGLESLVDETRGFDVGLTFGGEFGAAAGGAFRYDVEESASSALSEGVDICRRGCWDQGSEGENSDE